MQLRLTYTLEAFSPFPLHTFHSLHTLLFLASFIHTLTLIASHLLYTPLPTDTQQLASVRIPVRHCHYYNNPGTQALAFAFFML
jgi:hypothetical protein